MTCCPEFEVLRYFAKLKNVPLDECENHLKRVETRPCQTSQLSEHTPKVCVSAWDWLQALLGSPHLLLFDEPTTGLDPNLKKVFFQHCPETEKRRGVDPAFFSFPIRTAECRRSVCHSLPRTFCCGRLTGSASRTRAIAGAYPSAGDREDKIATELNLSRIFLIREFVKTIGWNSGARTANGMRLYKLLSKNSS